MDVILYLQLHERAAHLPEEVLRVRLRQMSMHDALYLQRTAYSECVRVRERIVRDDICILVFKQHTYIDRYTAISTPAKIPRTLLEEQSNAQLNGFELQILVDTLSDQVQAECRRTTGVQGVHDRGGGNVFLLAT